MAKINLLDKKVYNQIAAGEVVERPSSVIKELIENSIDAGATSIEVSIVGGGKDVIEVNDNGTGILKEDLKNAVLPHATSKIKDIADLDNITTLGFRGEALASISAVSKFTIASRTVDSEVGYELSVEGGEIGEVTVCPLKQGTYITVTNLFFNTPARQKFLKSERAEETDVTDVISRLMLANSQIAIKYSVDGNVVLQSFGEGLDDALIAVYGTETYKNCFKISNYSNGIKIEGFIGKHNFTKANRSYQTTVLNGRYIQNFTIQSAVHNAYQSYLMKRRYPFYCLMITMPSEVVDVNVTPHKSDVRFIDNSVVYASIYSTVSKVLDGTDSALDIITNFAETSSEQLELPKTSNETENEKTSKNEDFTEKYKDFEDRKYVKEFYNGKPTKLYLKEQEKRRKEIFENEEKKTQSAIDVFAENKKYIEELERKKLEETATQTEVQNKLDLKYIGQVLNTYLILEGNGDMYMIDQHAAHERLLYNKILYDFDNKTISVQPLLIPFVLKLNPYDYEKLYAKQSYLNGLGIEVKDVDGDFTVLSIPSELTDMDINAFFEDVLHDDYLNDNHIPEFINEKLMQKACKSAIKAGKSLDNSEVNSLLKLLNNNITLKCPHGRPIAVRITRQEIDKWFKRIV